MSTVKPVAAMSIGAESAVIKAIPALAQASRRVKDRRRRGIHLWTALENIWKWPHQKHLFLKFLDGFDQFNSEKSVSKYRDYAQDLVTDW